MSISVLEDRSGGSDDVLLLGPDFVEVRDDDVGLRRRPVRHGRG